MTTTAPAVLITLEQFKVARYKIRQARPAELGWSTWLAISTVCSCRHISLSNKRRWRLSDCNQPCLELANEILTTPPIFSCLLEVLANHVLDWCFQSKLIHMPSFHFLQNYNTVKTWARQNPISTKYGKQISWAMWRAANSTTALVVVAPIRVDSECDGSEGSVAVWLG